MRDRQAVVRIWMDECVETRKSKLEVRDYDCVSCEFRISSFVIRVMRKDGFVAATLRVAQRIGASELRMPSTDHDEARRNGQAGQAPPLQRGERDAMARVDFGACSS
jgi:hypothetical protein